MLHIFPRIKVHKKGNGSNNHKHGCGQRIEKKAKLDPEQVVNKSRIERINNSHLT